MFAADWLEKRETLSPEKVALVDATDGGRRITYRAWNRAARRTARLLARLGVGRGERVALLAHNCAAWLDVWFACAKLGAVLQPLNARLAATELAALLADAEPTVLVYGPEFSAQRDVLAAAAPSLKALVAIGRGEAGRLGSAEQSDPQAAGRELSAGRGVARSDPGRVGRALEVVPLDARDAESDEPLPPVRLAPGDAWTLCYTGGSTGVAKAAVLTYESVLANAVNTSASWGLSCDDVALLNAPLFHTGGMNVFTSPLVQLGGTSVVCAGFDVEQVFDLVEARAITVMFGVPTMFLMLQAHPRWAATDFAQLKLVISGGAPCPPPVFEKFFAKGVAFRTGYGLTEAGPNNFWLPGEEVRRRPGFVGVPLIGVDARVMGEQGERGPGEVGELCLRGPHLFGGYWRRPRETAHALRDGWLHTGDLAERDAEGFFRIVGRVKDLIISGGENIYPAEIEAVLSAHPAIAEVAVVGVADPKWGEVPHAVVVAKSGVELDEAALIAHCRERLARYKLPRTFHLRSALPRTAAGKVDRRRIAAELGG